MRQSEERLLIVVLTAALVVALFAYFPLGRRAAEAELARASSEAELPGVYYSRASAGFDDTLVSFGDEGDDDDELHAEAAAEAPEKTAAAEPEDDDEEDMSTFSDPVIP